MKSTPISLDPTVNPKHFRAVLVGSGLKMKTTQDGIRIVLTTPPKKGAKPCAPAK